MLTTLCLKKLFEEKATIREGPVLTLLSRANYILYNPLSYP